MPGGAVSTLESLPTPKLTPQLGNQKILASQHCWLGSGLPKGWGPLGNRGLLRYTVLQDSGSPSSTPLNLHKAQIAKRGWAGGLEMALPPSCLPTTTLQSSSPACRHNHCPLSQPLCDLPHVLLHVLCPRGPEGDGRWKVGVGSMWNTRAQCYTPAPLLS